MTNTPEENRPSGPEQPRWGQRHPEGSLPHSPAQGSGARPDAQPGGYGAPAGYGQQSGHSVPSSYGQPQNLPPMGPYSGPQGAHSGGMNMGPAQKPKRPITLILALVLMLLAGATALILSIMSFLNFISMSPEDMSPFWNEAFEEAQAQQGAAGEEITATDMMYGLGVFVLIGGIILAVLYTVFAFVGTMAGNVGRILATIFLAGSVFLVLFGPANLIVTGLSLAAIVALWLPASNTFIRNRKAWKDASRSGSHYGDPSGGNSHQGQYGPGPVDQGSYNSGPQSPDTYNPGPYNQGPYGSAPQNQGPYYPGADSQSPRENPYR